MNMGSGVSAIAEELLYKNPPLPLLNDEVQAPSFIQAIDQTLTLRKARHDLWLPNLAHPTINNIVVMSDYGGEDKSGQFNTYSFLFAGYDLLQPCLDKLKQLRMRHGLANPFREVCFKEFRYGPVGRCIPDWLHTMDAVTGLLFTLVVPKSVYSLFGVNNKKTLQELSEEMKNLGFEGWKGATAEKALRIIHIVGYFLGLMTRSGQNVFWMTDNDSIVANENRVKDVRRLLAYHLAQYGHGKFGKVSIGTPFERSQARYSITEFLSLPDLAAGSIQSILVEDSKGADAAIRLQTNSVLLWLAHQSVFLKKMTIHVRTNAIGQIEIATTEFIPKEHQSLKEVRVGKNANLTARVLKKLQTKISLTRKYSRKSRRAGSQTKRRRFAFKALKYERQANQLFWHG